METVTPVAVMFVFLGAGCGALLIAIERHSRMQRLRLAFQTDLQAICDRPLGQPDNAIGVEATEERPGYVGPIHARPQTQELNETVSTFATYGEVDCPRPILAPEATVARMDSHVNG